MKKNLNKLGLSIEKSEYGVPSISKRSVSAVAEIMYNNILEGESSAISTAEFFKFTSEVEKRLKELSDENGNNDFVGMVRDEIERNSDGGNSYLSKFGTKLSAIEAGHKYDYTVCNDPIWNSLTAQIDELKSLIKKREDFLKVISTPTVMSITDPQTGEILEDVELYPPIKTSTSTFKVELLKD